jgi:AraC-like DNA-binding protein
MFYTSANAEDIRGTSSELTLRILTSVFVKLTKWANTDLRAPYWRLYWKENSGASIITGKKTIPLEASHFVLIPPETSFTTSMANETNHFYVHFLTSLIWSNTRAEVLPVSPSDLKTINSILHGENTASSACLVASLVTSALARLDPEKWASHADLDARVQTAIQKIETQTPGVPSIAFLAREAGMNINAFIRLFRDRTGLTPALYARERRIEAACLLLHHSHKTIEEIASTCGFCDRYHFTHAFIRSRKISPVAFRKQIRR